MLVSSLRRLLSRPTASRPSAGRLRLEALEERAQPAVVTWTNPAGGDWSVPSNWSTGRLPAAGDDVVINLDGVTVNHNGGNDTIHSLTTSASANFVLGGGALTLLGHSTLNGAFTFNNAFLTQRGELDLDGSFTWTAGTLAGHGQTIANGNVTLSTGTKSMVAQTLETAVSATWTGGSLLLSSNATWNNLSTSTIDIRFDATLSGGTLDNAGALLKSAGAGTTSLTARLVNSGYLEVSSGTLALGGGGVSTGAMVVDAGATLNFTNGTDTLTASSTLGGAGAAGFTGANVTLAGSFAVSGTTTVSAGTVNFDGGATLNDLTLSGGTLGGAGDHVVGGMLTWTGGTLTGGGTTFANGGMMISGSNGKVLNDHALVNAGAAVWIGTGSVNFFASASFDNSATGTFDIQTDGTFGGLGAVLTNEGTLGKSAGTGTTTVNGDLVTTGVLQVASGTWVLGGDLENHGEVDVASANTLQVNGFFAQVEGTINLGGTLTLTGTGNLLDLEGGILNGSGTINASVVNAAVVNPGGDGSAGVLTINGSFTQTSSGVVSIDLGGTTAGTEYDQLIVHGAVSLDGTLRVQLINGYDPALNDAFQVMTWTSRSGDFANRSFPTLGGGLALVENLENTDLRLEIQTP
jgi:hypothetical protein